MAWNWTFDDWPHFTFDGDAMLALERAFLVSTGEVAGTIRYMDAETREELRIEILIDEALTTSRIEGEVLDRASVQSSLCRQFGLAAHGQLGGLKERGIAEMTADVYRCFATALDDATLFRWHRMMLAGARHIEIIGGYRTHVQPMQIVSGALERPQIHFEAPPSARVPQEMAEFVRWFNDTGAAGPAAMPALTRAGLSHLYFESIHPFEDGNGRIGRALAEKSLAQSIGRPSLIALSQTIERDRKSYYDNLERYQGGLDVTGWLVYFGQTILDAQNATLARIGFILAKARFYESFDGLFNERQHKAIARMFREGPDGFKGGMSAEKYIAITQASRSTATRDLQDLVDKGAMRRTGERRYARYTLAVDSPSAR